MSISACCAVALVAAFLATYLKQTRPEYGALISLAASCIIFAALLAPLSAFLYSVKSAAVLGALKGEYITLMLKITAIAYLAQFCGELCRDMGESALAARVETAGKVAIATLALPIVRGVFELLNSIL